MKLSIFLTKIQSMPLILRSFFGGVLYALGFPHLNGPSLFIFPIIGYSLFFSTLTLLRPKKKEEVRLKKDFLHILSFSFGFFVYGFYWIPHVLVEFGEIARPFNYLLGSLLTFFILPHLLFFILILFFTQKFIKYEKLDYLSSPLKILLLAILITLLEGFTPQQFPAYIGHSWLSLAPRLGLAPILGQISFSFFSFWLALVLWKSFQDKSFIKIPLLFILLFLGINLLIPLKKSGPNTKGFGIRMVQANIGNFLKISSETGEKNSIKSVKKTYHDLSTLPTQFPLDLIIWPETSYPTSFNSKLLKKMSYFTEPIIREVINLSRTELFIGGYDKFTHKEGDFKTEYNSALFFDGDSKLQDVYHKRRLIPFGEGLPFGPFNKFLSQFAKNVSFFAEGEKFTLFKTRKDFYFTSAICYEILFSHFIREMLNSFEYSPHFLINLTNDSWYGRTSEPFQHLFLSKWRALEFNLPIIRITNTGISSVLFPDGSESKRTKIFSREILDVNLKLSERPPTFYQKWGLFPLIGIWAMLVIITEIAFRRFKIT